ncbi:uncharacterized protein LOC134206342 [Armigeres subalbatus]|uniref:uncharacterized protein LOC134206342 n=1 Tax=Armigeres subalbatus TaxID=124917 RepID=UPI002ED02E1F
MSNKGIPANPADGTPEKDKPSGCACCDRPETFDNIVQCDQCNEWWHMTCAEVTPSVAERSWICGHCMPLSVLSRTTTSSARVARLALKKKQLEEQQAMEQRHLAEKYKLLEDELDEAGSNRSRISKASNRSRISKRASMDKVKQWQQECAEQSEGASALLPEDQSANPETFSAPAEVVVHTQQKFMEANPNHQHTGEDHQASCFYTPTLNSTMKPNDLNPSLANQDQQRNTGAIPKTAPNKAPKQKDVNMSVNSYNYNLKYLYLY